MSIVIFIVGLVFGLFAFSQIIYPLFSAWPRAKRLEREGKLKTPIPISTFLIAPIIWGVLMWISVWTVDKFSQDNLNIYYISLVIILFVVIIQIPKQNRNLEADFKNSWKKYLKEE
ncbi:hypothetical protein L6274_02195 [Candidatus Parcubacteria bacterium]|nr:hypothetical protein [Candidatus Parcubacteria bacterium]MCG2809715.1 hypothetical protein [Candidatus Portnoybacteria bacterium]